MKKKNNRERGRVVAVQLTLQQTDLLYVISDALLIRPTALCRKWILEQLRRESAALNKSGTVVDGFLQENLFQKGRMLPAALNRGGKKE